MRYFLLKSCAVLALLASGQAVHAEAGPATQTGNLHWWNAVGVTEAGQGRFLQALYDAMRRYYDLLDNIDWVQYYKGGYQVSGQKNGDSGDNQRIQYAPVFVSPQMQCAVPNSAVYGAPKGPMAPNPAMFQAMSGGFPGYQPLPWVTNSCVCLPGCLPFTLPHTWNPYTYSYPPYYPYSYPATEK